ncbi:LacI family DNA-binding transcriptional regulator [Novosphingobium sp. P6W]|uniref:LacI family DNA-binding transcriptional regulator n=1 Tax=Novosphingobium sp. P6W TaxID=1609758 RepID=UPI0013B38806|nr:LacI family DNA-binding transcriptional regulator [Novosphingobium sp. P6W]
MARKAGVSIGTVSNSLNDRPGVSGEVRRRVLAAVEALGYRPNRAARATRTGRTGTLAFVTPDLRNPYYPQLAQAISQAARRAGYAVLLVDTEDGTSERERIEQIEHYGVDGILWCPATSEDVISDSALSTPVVVIDHWLPGRDNVSADYRMSGKLIADHVLAAGYRSIGMLSGPPEISAARLRRDSFVEFVAGRVPLAWEIIHPFDMRLTDEAIAAIRSAEAGVIVCCDDLMALGALQAAREAGLSVPRDVAIIGHDDLPFCSVTFPGITTVRQPLEELGQEAVSLLIDRMVDISRPTRRVTLDVELIQRESTHS